ncbi:hypothetical protein V5O48_000340 [Marasmius crinis-equi]|uniref:Uncharacterized protein n=1 Tax=Marasmius crinis-equi TaxID=585013 RepID=A0ABR3G1N7_9AGAR
MDGSPQIGKAGSFTLRAPADVATEPDNELFLKYGSHCNRVLFVEYGFVLPHSETEQTPYEVGVDDMVEAMFQEKGDLGLWAKSMLETEGYWQDYTLHVSGPSYRLVTALRLYAMIISNAPPATGSPTAFLAPWTATITGQSDCVSDDNESQWVQLLVNKICHPIIKRAENGVKKSLDENEGTELSECIRVLWEEEQYVALCICERVRNGDELA